MKQLKQKIFQDSNQLPALSLLGTSALLLEAPGELELATQQRIWALAEAANRWPETGEAVPGMNNLMLMLDKTPKDISLLCQRLIDTWLAVEPLILEGRIIELPVIYGGIDTGPHIGDVVAHTGFSKEEIAELHSAPLYPVYALGSHPGYCYLGNMDSRIATPRRKIPVTNLPGGSVSIGGVQTGVSASPGPSGWNTIGRTHMNFFDISRNPPTLCAPGDFIRFRIEKVL